MDYEKEINNLKQSVENVYKISFVFWILFMQCGFVFLEAGSIRSKNTTAILFKNLMDMVVGALVFWAFGFSFVMGEPGNSFIGYNHFFSSFLLMASNSSQNVNSTNVVVGLTENEYYPVFVHHLAFAVTSSTIVSGALAERTQFGCYIVYSFMITGFIFPVIAHWTWSDTGWLYTGAGTGIHYKDYAGSGTVHVVGGSISLVGVCIIGAREGRFIRKNHIVRAGHSIPFVSLGGFILIIGFLAFNGGSLTHITEEGDAVKISRVITNSILAGSSSAVTSMLLKFGINKYNKSRLKWSLLDAINGCLTGMVAVCAGADSIQPWAASLTGLFGGVSYIVWDFAMARWGLDDALGAVPVHLGGGLVGCLTAPLLSFEGLFFNEPSVKGVIYDWSAKSWRGFGWNILGTICIMTWSMTMSGILFHVLKLIGMLRVTTNQERNGLDVELHELAYPELLNRGEQHNNKVHPL